MQFRPSVDVACECFIYILLSCYLCTLLVHIHLPVVHEHDLLTFHFVVFIAVYSLHRVCADVAIRGIALHALYWVPSLYN